MARIAAVIAMIGALHFGGMALLSHDAHAVANDGKSINATINSLAAQLNAGTTALHHADGPSAQSGAAG